MSGQFMTVDDADDEYRDILREHEWTAALSYGYLPSLEQSNPKHTQPLTGS
jgi:hypothetical protein